MSIENPDFNWNLSRFCAAPDSLGFQGLPDLRFRSVSIENPDFNWNLSRFCAAPDSLGFQGLSDLRFQSLSIENPDFYGKFVTLLSISRLIRLP